VEAQLKNKLDKAVLEYAKQQNIFNKLTSCFRTEETLSSLQMLEVYLVDNSKPNLYTGGIGNFSVKETVGKI